MPLGFNSDSDTILGRGILTMTTQTTKTVTYTITGASIFPGKGKDAKAGQAIFEIHGVVRRSDMREPLKGNSLDWTPALKANASMDTSAFDPETNSGTIVITATIGKNGRRPAAPVAGGKATSDLLALA